MKFLALTILCAGAFAGQLSAGTSASDTTAEQKKQNDSKTDIKKEQTDMSKLFLIDMQSDQNSKKNDMKPMPSDDDEDAAQMSILLVGTSPSQPTQDEAKKKTGTGTSKQDEMEPSLLLC
jgi:hypothetical protein